MSRYTLLIPTVYGCTRQITAEGAKSISVSLRSRRSTKKRTVYGTGHRIIMSCRSIDLNLKRHGGGCAAFCCDCLHCNFVFSTDCNTHLKTRCVLFYIHFYIAAFKRFSVSSSPSSCIIVYRSGEFFLPVIATLSIPQASATEPL